MPVDSATLQDRRGFLRRAMGAAVFAVPPFHPPGRGGGWAALEASLEGRQTTAMVVLIGGERAWTWGDDRQVSYLASARKSLVSMLYGPSAARGDIRLDATLAEIGLDDKGGLLPRERQARVIDLLRSRSGVYHPAANGGDATDRAPARGTVRPGSRFLYNNWDFNALGAVFERATGRGLYRAFTEDIAAPIGLEDWAPDLQQSRNDTGLSDHPAQHFALSARDMARLGQLMLDGGAWRGRRVLPAGWVRRTTRLITPAAEVARDSPFIDGLGYGCCWWVFDGPRWPAALRGAYTASGAFGQFITVAPVLKAVVVHKTAVPPPRNVPAEAYFGTILPAVLAAIAPA
ncbi:serine hydrolase domain-containing protein [Caulobacter mirabilis]|uniref:Serine hydrolase n=1 Tax=Caulobacter mirabilis TaxID=69666 RepID=A0A2D2AYQ3_9CAUL|nr:serine hydrolase [Caulobacter mirabilis]ATQ43140.1 serine hydrolase [Caulobacter mirabilis]